MFPPDSLRKTLGEKLKLVWKKHFPEEAAALEAKEKEKEKEIKQKRDEYNKRFRECLNQSKDLAIVL